MSQLQAVAPAFGVQLKVRDSHIELMISDLGGRGEPHLLAILPVAVSNGKVRMVDTAGQSVTVPNWDALIHPHAGTYVDFIKDAVFPFVKEIPKQQWPKSQLVLLLLIYEQARGIGGTAGIRPLVAGGGTVGSIHDPIADAIRAALENCGVAELRGGLIAGSLPGAVPQADSLPVTFALASCHYPSDILDRMPVDENATPGPADASLLALSKLMGARDSPSLLLLAGDQVYVDETAGLFDPKAADDKFRIPYEIRAQSRGAKSAFQRLDMPVHAMIDGHEIHYNWAPNDPGETDIAQGKASYWIYQRARRDADFETPIWFHFVHRGLPFFLGDTRTEREPRTALNMSLPMPQQPQIMSTRQFRALCDWMLKSCSLPKLLLTASALLPRRLEVARDPACSLHSDAWDGYPRSLHALLQFACDNEIGGLVFFSGGEHISSFTTATVTDTVSKKSCTLHSINSSALYAPYPFANGTKDDYEFDDSFCFPDAGKGPYRCCVKTEFAPGDGFALVSVDRSKEGCELLVKFHAPDGIKPGGKFASNLGLASAGAECFAVSTANAPNRFPDS